METSIIKKTNNNNKKLKKQKNKTMKEQRKEKKETNLQCFVCMLLLSSISALYRPLPF